jgi:hypothetical protein
MKKRIGIGAVIFLALMISQVDEVRAEGLYFDVGVDFGKAWTVLREERAVKVFEREVGEDAIDVGAGMSLKAGYGPIVDSRFYGVVEGSLIGSMIISLDSNKVIWYDSFMTGVGIIYYPLYLLQIGSTVGLSWNYTMGGPEYLIDRTAVGIAWNVTVAADIGEGEQGILLGIKYYGSVVGIESKAVIQAQHMIGIFVKYAYRLKMPWWE